MRPNARLTHAVELECVCKRAIGHGRKRRLKAQRGADDGRLSGGAVTPCVIENYSAPRQGRAIVGGAYRIDHARLGTLDDVRGNFFKRKIAREMRERVRSGFLHQAASRVSRGTRLEISRSDSRSRTMLTNRSHCSARTATAAS